MEITFDPAKRDRTLQERGLDFSDAAEVFRGITATAPDERHEYGEPRFITAGYLRGRFVVLVWTPRGTARRIISMRYGHADEERNWLG
ncbi:BrnT family toxin [Roseomonas chloroacetimidivorans]|uniref:BrnT family toxin n=1 Tax=Roseomonas chloroacetimidivorans TaxID=1766656 RepID=UPI003C727ACF